MKDELIINGITYRAVTPDVKEEKRIEGWIDLKDYGQTWKAMSEYKTLKQTTRMIEIKENEIVLSEDDVRKSYNQYYSEWPVANFSRFLELLGFKKDGV